MGSTTSKSRCAALNSRGEPCGAPPLEGERFCYWHSPTTLEQRQAARSRGGKARHGRSLAEPVDGREFKTLSDMVDVLSDAIRSTLGLEPSVSLNRCIGYLCRCWSDVYAVGELEARVQRLEEVVK